MANQGAVQQPRSRRWWWEPELLLLALIVLIALFVRLYDLSLRGEETRRAHIGQEMLRTGDWVVPHCQGHVTLFRPPLQNWIIAAGSWLAGECNVWTIRLPSVIASLILTVLLYGWGRSFLSRLGAFTTAISYPTMLQVLRLGGRGETEAVFTLFVGGSLIVWHWGWLKRWPSVLMWSASYCLMALGMLTKGMQAPVYFIMPVAVFLFLRGEWKSLFTRAHLCGIAAFALIFGAWLAPFYGRMGWEGVSEILGQEASVRFWQVGWTTMLRHLVLYPATIFASMLPWSVLLLYYFRKPVRDSIGNAWPAVVFCVTCMAVTFPTVWLAPGALTRYWMPVFPCICPLFGLIVQRCSEAGTDSPLRRWWTWFTDGWVLVLLAAPLYVLAGSRIELVTGRPLSQPAMVGAGFILVSAALLLLIYRGRDNKYAARMRWAVFAVAACVSLCYSVLYVNYLVKRTVPTAQHVARLKQEIGHAPLTSFGPGHHVFVFHYGGHVRQIAWPETASDVPKDVKYFCAHIRDLPNGIPFEWEKIADINCDRYDRSDPENRIIIGRRKASEKIRSEEIGIKESQ